MSDDEYTESRKYYRNVITVEVLSNEPWGDEVTNLQTVNYEITDGMSIGYVARTVTNEELTRDAAVRRDIAMGGDGGFLTGLVGEDESET